jgi:hypothetical protein
VVLYVPHCAFEIITCTLPPVPTPPSLLPTLPPKVKEKTTPEKKEAPFHERLAANQRSKPLIFSLTYLNRIPFRRMEPPKEKILKKEKR